MSLTPLDLLCETPFHDADAPTRALALSRLADTELFAALTQEPADDRAELQIYELPEGPVALACDLEERLAGFVGGPVAYVALPGRLLVAALAAEGRGLLVNPGQPSQMLLEPGVLQWLTGALEARPNLAPDAAPADLRPPEPATVADLAGPLSLRLGDMVGLVARAALFGSVWADGRRNHTLLLLGVAETHREALAKAFAELLAFLPEQPGGVDIAFADSALPPVALVLDIPEPQAEAVAPQRDPKAPPRLRW
jgi:hypothetical protein